VPDLEVELHAKPDRLSIWPGAATRVWRYDSSVIQDEPNALAFLSDGYAPVLRVRRGQKLRVGFVNELPEPTIIHWHGLMVSASMDGHPRDAIAPGQRYRYEFDVRIARARTGFTRIPTDAPAPRSTWVRRAF
jgi:FtsP/CotA-like multicopper oxidase with cupredoxin domain